METVIVELKHVKALKLLEELEEMEIIKLHPQPDNRIKDKADKYWGILSEEAGESLLRHIQQARGEWDERSANI